MGIPGPIDGFTRYELSAPPDGGAKPDALLLGVSARWARHADQCGRSSTPRVVTAFALMLKLRNDGSRSQRRTRALQHRARQQVDDAVQLILHRSGVR